MLYDTCSSVYYYFSFVHTVRQLGRAQEFCFTVVFFKFPPNYLGGGAVLQCFTLRALFSACEVTPQETTSSFCLLTERIARHQRIHFLLLTQRLTGRFSSSPLRQSTLAFRDLDAENSPTSASLKYHLSLFVLPPQPVSPLYSPAPGALRGLQQRHCRSRQSLLCPLAKRSKLRRTARLFSAI